MTHTIDTTATPPRAFRLQAALQLLPAEGDGPRRFAMRAYDGGLLRLGGAPLPVVVDLTGLTAVDQVKALLHHDTSRPVGHMTRVTIGDEIDTEGVLSVPEHAERIVEAQRNGFEWEASIGASVEEYETVPRGRTASVNGRQFRGPIMIARKSTLREVSFVGAGAGENTSATVAASAVTQESSMADPVPAETNVEKEEPIAAEDTTEGATELEQLQALRAEVKQDLEAIRKIKAEMDSASEAEQREETTEAVEEIAASLGVRHPELIATLKTQAKEGKIKKNDVELHLLRASRTGRLGQLQPLGAKSGAPAMPQVLEASLCLTAGWSEQEIGKQFQENVVNEAISNRWHGFGPKGLMVEYLQAHGHHVLGGQLRAEDIQAGVTLAQNEIRAAGGFATLSLPGILSNVAKKELLRGYEAVDGAILKIAKRSTASDYKPYFMYRLNTSGLLQQVGQDGELKSMELREDEYTSRVYPWGRKLALTDVMFVNDDLGAFSDLARLFGVLTARTIEKTGFTALLSDASNFWTTGKGNRVASGAGSALSLASLEDAYKLFLEAVDADGEPITIEPKYLLTGPADAVTARNLNQSTIVNLAVAGDTDVAYERPNQNPFQGMFEPVMSPYLVSSRVPNATSTQWLLCANPTITSPIVASFLDGREGPQIKTWEALPGRLGMQWDVSAHFGFNLHDDKASVYSPGA